MITPKKPNIRGRASQNSTTSGNNQLSSPGPYLAKIVSHLDKRYGGGLEVELLKSTTAGNNYDAGSQTITVKYASPFYGVTPLQNNDANDGYSNTQQSYGFWAVPPDVGSKVLVMFVEGDISQGYWFACVQDDYMNFMIPEPRVSTTLTTLGTPSGLAGKKLPVGEYNKFLANPNNNYPTSQPKPYNETFVERMTEQGLVDDDIRGTTSTSARREVPSNVYGMSTPGPLDKRDGAPKNQRGIRESKATVFSSRLGGHSLIMDDGDETILRRGPASDNPSEYVNVSDGSTDGDAMLPANEMFRIRTRTGHQILLHNTEDLIYISNSRGTSWIEMSSNGKIDIYAQDSVSVHSQQDLNFTADRDINFTARENMNVNIGKNYKNTIGGSYSFTSSDFYSVLSGNSVTFQTESFFSVLADASATIQSTEDLNLVSGGSAFLSANTQVNISSDSTLNIGSKSDINLHASGDCFVTSDTTNITTNGALLMTVGGAIHQTAATTIYTTAGLNLHQKAASTIYTNAGASINMLAGTLFNAQAGSSFNILSASTMALQSSGGSITVQGEVSVDINGGTSAGPAAPAAAASPAAPALTPGYAQPEAPRTPFEAPPVARIPEHEPWLQHENLDPTQFLPNRTRAGEQQTDVFKLPIPDTYIRTSLQPSTVGATYGSSSYGNPDGSTGLDPESENSEYSDAGMGLSATGPVAPLLAMIRLAEANNNYNAKWGGITLSPPRTLTTLTIGEVMAWQEIATSAAHPQTAKPTSSAAGAYQITQVTLNGIYASAGLTLSSVYNVENQDKLGLALLEYRGLNKFRSGKMPITDFANSIAQEWAAFPVTTPIIGHLKFQLKIGQSYYDGVGSNSATSRFTYRDVLATLEQMRTATNGASASGVPDMPPGIGGGASGNSGRGDGSVPSASETVTDVPTGGLSPTNNTSKVFYDYPIEDYRTVGEAALRARGPSEINKARPMRIQQQLFQVLNDAAYRSGIDQVRIYSGGQISEGEARALGARRVPGKGVTMAVGNQKVRTGTTRHNNGRAADIYLKKNGRVLTAASEADRDIMTVFFVYAAQLGLHTAAHPYMEIYSFHVDCITNEAPHYLNTSQWLIDAMETGKRRR